MIRIVNRSNWPTTALKIICRWVAKKEELGRYSWTRNYTFTFRNTKSLVSWSGRGWFNRCTIRMNRRWQAPIKPDGSRYPHLRRDHRYQGAFEERYDSRLEVLIGLLAHEVRHATTGNERRYQRRGAKRLDVVGMEKECNRAGKEAVAAWKIEGPAVLRRIAARCRRERQRKVRRNVVLPNQKFLHAQAMLEKWQRKMALTKTKLKRWARTVKYYESRQASAAKNK